MSPVFAQTDLPSPSTAAAHTNAGATWNTAPDRATIHGPGGGRRGGERRGGQRASTVLATLLLVFLLGACTGGVREPTSYGEANIKGEGFYGNLMYGCTGVEPDADGNYVDEKLSSSEYCRCLFEGLRDRVPFADVRDFEAAQADAEAGKEPAIPDEIARVQKDCAKKHPVSN